MEGLRRLTVSADPEAFPCKIAYVSGDQLTLWWDIRFLFIAMKAGGNAAFADVKEWKKRCTSLLRKKQLLG